MSSHDQEGIAAAQKALLACLLETPNFAQEVRAKAGSNNVPICECCGGPSGDATGDDTLKLNDVNYPTIRELRSKTALWQTFINKNYPDLEEKDENIKHVVKIIRIKHKNRISDHYALKMLQAGEGNILKAAEKAMTDLKFRQAKLVGSGRVGNCPYLLPSKESDFIDQFLAFAEWEDELINGLKLYGWESEYGILILNCKDDDGILMWPEHVRDAYFKRELIDADRRDMRALRYDNLRPSIRSGAVTLKEVTEKMRKFEKRANLMLELMHGPTEEEYEAAKQHDVDYVNRLTPERFQQRVMARNAAKLGCLHKVESMLMRAERVTRQDHLSKWYEDKIMADVESLHKRIENDQAESVEGMASMIAECDYLLARYEDQVFGTPVRFSSLQPTTNGEGRTMVAPRLLRPIEMEHQLFPIEDVNDELCALKNFDFFFQDRQAKAEREAKKEAAKTEVTVAEDDVLTRSVSEQIRELHAHTMAVTHTKSRKGAGPADGDELTGISVRQAERVQNLMERYAAISHIEAEEEMPMGKGKERAVENGSGGVEVGGLGGQRFQSGANARRNRRRKGKAAQKADQEEGN